MVSHGNTMDALSGARQDPGFAGRHSSKLYGGRKADRADESGQLLWSTFVDGALQYRTGTYRRRGGLRFRMAAGACRVARPSPRWNQGEDGRGWRLRSGD